MRGNSFDRALNFLFACTVVTLVIIAVSGLIDQATADRFHSLFGLAILIMIAVVVVGGAWYLFRYIGEMRQENREGGRTNRWYSGLFDTRERRAAHAALWRRHPRTILFRLSLTVLVGIPLLLWALISSHR
jgi:hypothetical protein